MTTNQFTKGLNLDVHPKYQEEGTYRFALNAVLETEFGEYATISNEPGNIAFSNVSFGEKVVVGHCLLDNDEVFLALYDPNGLHEVGLYNSATGVYNALSADIGWNFDLRYPVHILFRVRNGCERVIYMTDNYNEYRAFNITDTSYWLDPEDGSLLEPNRLLLYKNHNIPCISLLTGEGDIGIFEGTGNLEVGVYYFALRYLDKELNPTNWLLISRPIAIGHDSFSYTRAQVTTNLYVGGSNVPDSPYFVPKTNKSIGLLLNQLDFQTFPFYQLAVVKRTGDAGEISTVNTLTAQPISAATATYVYTGLDGQIEGETSVEDLLSNLQPIDLVGSHAQLDNRLYLANTTNTNYDWSTFQRYATKIKTLYVKDPTTSPVDTFVKQGQYYFGAASFMADEIYALGIVYVMEDGTLSPVFHIPGRAPNTVEGDNPYIGEDGVAYDGEDWDTGELTSYGVGLPFSKTKRWQQISTATIVSPFQNRGYLGYHEATTATYPELEACDGEPYWGEDWQGNTIDSTTKIRHHRMPGEELIGSAIDQAGYSQVGLLFSNVEYPPNAVKHFFVYGDRTFERTVLAKGLLIPLPTVEEFVDNAVYAGEPPFGNSVLSPFRELFNEQGDLVFAPQLIRPTEIPTTETPIENLRSFAFLCTEGIYKDKVFAPSYFKLEKYLRDTEYGIGLGHNRDVSVTFIPRYNTDLSIQTDLWHFRNSEQPSDSDPKFNYDVQFCGKLPKAVYGDKFGSVLTNPVDRTVQNLSFNISPLVITLEDQLKEWKETTLPPDTYPYGALKIDGDPFTNLYSIQYKRTGNCPLTATTLNSAFLIFGGDSFVGRLHLTDYSYAQSEEDGKTLEAYHIAFPTQDTLINPEFRANSNDPVYSYFPWNYEYATEGHKQLRQHIATKYYESVDDLMEVYPQNWFYNDSFSYLQNLEVYLPLPFNYEFCNNCIEKNPYRIYYSDFDSAETQSDAYRLFRPNNYKDLDGSTGVITDLFSNFNQLYARTTNSIFYLPTRPQQLKTDDATNIYIGTGEVLSLPAQALKTSENAFGGGRFIKSRASTEYGSVYVDDISGRIFLLTNQLNDISMLGMRNFFQQHGKIEFFTRFLNDSLAEFPIESNYFVGYISTYDPRFKRVIIHKRDFLPLGNYIFDYSPTDTDEIPELPDSNRIVFNGFSFYVDRNGETTKIEMGDPLYFENRSFTISYSFITKQWVSFHSYLPTYMFHGHNNFFSFTDNIYAHNTPLFTTYYGKKHPHIIDMIAMSNPVLALPTTSITYSSNAWNYDSFSKTYVPADVTFDSFIAYNSSQSTGKVNLTLKATPFDTAANAEALVKSTDKQYRINRLRDISLNSQAALWTTDWQYTQSDYFIDKVPYLPNLDVNKSGFEKPLLRDHYLGLRLFFNPISNTKINTDIVNTMSSSITR